MGASAAAAAGTVWTPHAVAGHLEQCVAQRAAATPAATEATRQRLREAGAAAGVLARQLDRSVGDARARLAAWREARDDRGGGPEGEGENQNRLGAGDAASGSLDAAAPDGLRHRGSRRGGEDRRTRMKEEEASEAIATAKKKPRVVVRR